MKDPYVYEGTNVLINKAGINDQEKLDSYESAMANLAIVGLLKDPIRISGADDIFPIHKALFAEVYEWAGSKRTINIYKSEMVLNGLSVEYSDRGSIERDLKTLDQEMKNIAWDVLSKKELISKIARLISGIWKVHAFREGNTRTVCLFLYLLMKQLGLKLDVDFIGEHAKYFRNALVLASIGEYSEYEHLENILMDSVSMKVTEDGGKKYKTIKGYELDKYKYNYHSAKEE